MATRKSTGNTKSKGDTEAKVVALAEQLGWFLGTVQGKAEGWLDRDVLRKEVAKIRDGAAQLLQHVEAAARSAVVETGRPKAAGKPGVKAAAKPEAKKATKSAALAVKPSRGLVDAPGKKHRKPPPQERLDKRMGEPVGKQLGQKQFQPGHGARRA